LTRNTNSTTSNRPFGGFTKKLTVNMGVAHWHWLAKLARTDDEQRRVRESVQNTLELMWRFFDGLDNAQSAQVMNKAA